MPSNPYPHTAKAKRINLSDLHTAHDVTGVAATICWCSIRFRLLSPIRTALRPSPLPSRPKVLAFLAQRRVSWRSPTTSAQRHCPYSRAARALYWLPLSAWCYLAGLDVERVEPETAPRTMVHLFGVGVAFLVVVEEYNQSEYPHATHLRPELMAAFGTRSQHPSMLSRRKPDGYAS